MTTSQPEKALLSAFQKAMPFLTGKAFLNLLAGLLFLASASPVRAQSQGEVIQNWTMLEEAEFYFDVAYSVVRCQLGSEAMIMLDAFNEGGKVSAVGFSLKIKDANGKEATHEVEKFEIAFAATQRGKCETDEFSYLKFPVPDGIDPATLSIEITYNK